MERGDPLNILRLGNEVASAVQAHVEGIGRDGNAPYAVHVRHPLLVADEVEAEHAHDRGDQQQIYETGNKAVLRKDLRGLVDDHLGDNVADDETKQIRKRS